MVYISPSTQKFYLSRETLIQLGVISSNFPCVGGALEHAAIEHEMHSCGCLKRVPLYPREQPSIKIVVDSVVNIQQVPSSEVGRHDQSISSISHEAKRRCGIKTCTHYVNGTVTLAGGSKTSA